MKRIISLILILSLTVCTCACRGDDVSDQITNIAQMDNENIQSVKNAIPSAYPSTTYGEAFEDFFAYPSWKYFEGRHEGPDDDGDGEPDYIKEKVEVVEFTGYCTYQNVEVKALIQFTLDKNDGTFQATYLSFNDVPQSSLMMAGLFSKVFEKYDTQEATAEEGIEDYEETEGDMDYADDDSLNYDDNEEVYPEEEDIAEDLPADENYEYDGEALEYAGEYVGMGGYTIQFSAYSSVSSSEIGMAYIYYNGANVMSAPVYICYDMGDWEGTDYDAFYVMHMDGYDEYLGFYKQDGVYMMDYNGSTKNYDYLEMKIHYES